MKFRLLAYSDFHLCSLFLWVIFRQFSLMRETTEFQVKKEVLIKVGDRVFIDDIEWKVAEFIDDTVTLYREGVGGDSHTIHKTRKKVEHLFLNKENIEKQ